MSALLKHATSAYGGDDSDIAFEQSFANLAHAHLRNRAPILLDYELGFQLLDKDEENNHAVGAFGFKVGEQLLVAPVFFDKGKVKGYELLWLKDSDTFVPLKENWINYLLGRRPMVIGRPAGRQGRFAQPGADIRPYIESPSKVASDWVAEALPGIAWAMKNPPAEPDPASPATLDLVKASSHAAAVLCATVASQPRLGAVLEDAFPGLLKAAVASSRRLGTLTENRPKRAAAAPRPTGRLKIASARKEAAERTVAKIATYVRGGSTGDLTTTEIETLVRNGVLIKDARSAEEITQVLPSELPVQLHSPLGTGVYTALTNTGFEEALILHHPSGGPGVAPGVVLIRTKGDGAKDWVIAAATDVPVRTPEPDRAAHEKLWESLPESTDLSRDGTYVLIAKHGGATAPFRVRATRSIDRGSAYLVDWKILGGHHPVVTPQPQKHYRSLGNAVSQSAGSRMTGATLTIGRRSGTRVRIYDDGTVEVPLGYRPLKLKEADWNYVGSGNHDGSDDPPLAIGRLDDLLFAWEAKTARLEVRRTPDGYVTRRGGTDVQELSKSADACLLHLVAGHGLAESAARGLVEKAAGYRVATLRVKYAQPFPILPMPPENYSGDEFGGLMPIQESGRWSETVPAEEPPPPRRMQDIRPDVELMGSIDRAVQTGQREVIDASMLSGLLRATRDETLIDQHIGPLMRALDSAGRLIFGYYNKPDIFADRYGDAELKEIEDALRNNFDGLGDLVLYLKQNRIDPFDLKDQDIDLGEGGI